MSSILSERKAERREGVSPNPPAATAPAPTAPAASAPAASAPAASPPAASETTTSASTASAAIAPEQVAPSLLKAGSVWVTLLVFWLLLSGMYTPFLIAAGFIVAQQVTFETLGRIPAWGPMFGSVSYVNLPFLLLLTGIAGVGIAWHGWVAGARPRNPKAAMAA